MLTKGAGNELSSVIQVNNRGTLYIHVLITTLKCSYRNGFGLGLTYLIDQKKMSPATPKSEPGLEKIETVHAA